MTTNRPGYTKAWYQAHPAAAERAKKLQAARQRALTRLAKLHPKDFRMLWTHECDQAGIPW